MSTVAAGSMLMWLGGLSLGVGLTAPNYSLSGCGMFLSIMAALYIRLFVEHHDHR